MTLEGLTLALEVSNPGAGAGGVALGRADGTLLAEEPVAGPSRERDDLVCAMERACAAAGVSAADVRTVAVSLGPGGYTSVRTAYAAAAAVALARGAALVGVPTWRVAAFGVRRPCVVCLASKGETCHATLIDGDAERVLGVVDAKVVGAHTAACLVADEHLPRAFRERAHEHDIPIEVMALRASSVLALVAAGDGIEGPGGPIYPREPDAVTQWRARHGGA